MIGNEQRNFKNIEIIVQKYEPTKSCVLFLSYELLESIVSMTNSKDEINVK